MKMYIYDVENGDLENNIILVDTIEGIDNKDCEAKASKDYSDTDKYAWSYTEV